jgi:hypothetical protein
MKTQKTRSLTAYFSTTSEKTYRDSVKDKVCGDLAGNVNLTYCHLTIDTGKVTMGWATKFVLSIIKEESMTIFMEVLIKENGYTTRKDVQLDKDACRDRLARNGEAGLTRYLASLPL